MRDAASQHAGGEQMSYSPNADRGKLMDFFLFWFCGGGYRYGPGAVVAALAALLLLLFWLGLSAIAWPRAAAPVVE